MTSAKICGLSTPDAVASALDGKAAFVGFIFFPKSPRNVDPDLAAQLAEPARRRGVKVVAVVVDPEDNDLDRIVRIVRPDLIQLHGAETPARATQIGVRTGLGVIKAIPVSDAADLAAAHAFEDVAEHLMFDARPPKGSALPGGVGASFDWTILKDRKFKRPHFLAGGLDPWNVTEAVRQSGAPLVDVSSGVERGPGYKDPALIQAFLETVRRT